MDRLMDRLAAIEKKYEELGRMLSDPGIVASLDNLRIYSKEHSDLTPIVEAYRRYRSLHEQLAEVEGMIREEKDSDMVALAREEKDGLAGEMADLQGRLKRLLIPKDPLDEKNILLEIRAGTGGDEASLFVADLMRMYIRYAEQKGWSVETLSSRDRKSVV